MRPSLLISAPWNGCAELVDNSENYWVYREPKTEDGYDIHQLIVNSPPLDTNSPYCNFLQYSHFSDTSIIVEHNGRIVGFISGYLKPNAPSELFIWQVAVSPDYRGQGIAFKMLQGLLDRTHLDDVAFVETTITKDNKGSWALFKKLDIHNLGQGEVSSFLDKNEHFDGTHDTECLYRIPLNTQI